MSTRVNEENLMALQAAQTQNQREEGNRDDMATSSSSGDEALNKSLREVHLTPFTLDGS